MITPNELSDQAEMEGYIFFDRNIRSLPKKADGTIDTLQPGFQNNDVDAFRHAYVSGVFTLEYGERAAAFFGWGHEILSPSTREDENMDLWNNAVGRRLAKVCRTREKLAAAIKKSLEAGELIVLTADQRRYEGADVVKPDPDMPVIVLKEDSTGANELFYDLSKSITFRRDEFVAAIESGSYPRYTVRTRDGKKFPATKGDESTDNNLG